MFVAVEDFDFDPQEVDGDVFFADSGEAHTVFFGGEDGVHAALGATAEEPGNVALREAMVIDEMLGELNACSELAQAVLEAVRLCDGRECADAAAF